MALLLRKNNRRIHICMHLNIIIFGWQCMQSNHNQTIIYRDSKQILISNWCTLFVYFDDGPTSILFLFNFFIPHYYICSTFFDCMDLLGTGSDWSRVLLPWCLCNCVTFLSPTLSFLWNSSTFVNNCGLLFLNIQLMSTLILRRYSYVNYSCCLGWFGIYLLFIVWFEAAKNYLVSTLVT